MTHFALYTLQTVITVYIYLMATRLRVIFFTLLSSMPINLKV